MGSSRSKKRGKSEPALPEPRSAASLLPRFEQQLRARGVRELPGAATGLAELDSLIGGVRGLIALAGDPGAGKSALALQLALHIARSREAAVLYASIEMTERQMMERLVAHACEVEVQAVASGQLLGDAAYAAALAEGRRTIDDAGQMLCLTDRRDASSPGRLVAMARALRKRADAAHVLVILDSLQLAVARWMNERHASMKERIDAAMDRLHAATEKGLLSALVISQVTKDGSGSDGMFVFCGSGGIDHIADTTMVLVPSRRQGRASSDVRLLVPKNRMGPTGEVSLQFERRTLMFKEGRRRVAR